ncbi:DUF541 domain-containing protein [Cerasibacillus terrae]|uniref:DUF541 domain-containing protein n=1 Tax=Cerasibacillus terrae TaxID=2498845 RepID=A0A5C8NTN1_9BACI|nr:SIMPL domain-containing protein [Cerasibacillus terrae]TXL64523.1 DUF541 domain-containing protein [Cerasibacillus terrae]
MQYPYMMTNQVRSNLNQIITVFGEGSISVAPNIARIRISIQTENMQLMAAQQENANKTNQVIESLVQLGISRENIQTVVYDIHPQYDYIEEKQVFRGYEVIHGLSVQIENIGETGRVIDTAIKSGANRIEGIDFTVKHPQVIYQQALIKALENAQRKAETIARTLQLSLHTQPIKITEITKQVPQPYLATMEKSITPIQPGQITVQATVEVKYAY